MPRPERDGAPRLADCLRRLGEITRALTEGRLDVEDALDLYEEGVALYDHAQAILTQARLRVTQVVATTAAPDGGDAEDRPATEDGAAPR